MWTCPQEPVCVHQHRAAPLQLKCTAAHLLPDISKMLGQFSQDRLFKSIDEPNAVQFSGSANEIKGVIDIPRVMATCLPNAVAYGLSLRTGASVGKTVKQGDDVLSNSVSAAPHLDDVCKPGGSSIVIISEKLVKTSTCSANLWAWPPEPARQLRW